MDRLTDPDLKKLAACFITEEMANRAGLYRVNSHSGADLTGRTGSANINLAGLVFPYHMPGSDSPREFRLRLDDPQGEDGKNKYLTPLDARNKIYFPPGLTNADLQDISVLKVITESEKGCLALEGLATNGTPVRRFAPIAISGVYNWRGRVGKTGNEKGKRVDVKGVIPDFELVHWRGCDVTIIFDADAATNKSISNQQYQLADYLTSKGARVYIVDLPQDFGAKAGIDDVLGAWQAEKDTDYAMKKGLELLETKRLFSPGKLTAALDGGLTLQAEPARLGRCKITIFDEDKQPIAVDDFNISDATKRAKFVRELDFDDDKSSKISRILIDFANRSDILTAPISKRSRSGEEVETLTKVLEDGRIIDQITDLRFAVYDPKTKEKTVEESVTDSDGTTYVPVNDELLKMDIGGIYLPSELTDYGSEKELISAISEYINHYVDLKPVYLQIASYYVLFTYVFDKVLELSYLSATGPPGSGKSRLGYTLALASYHGYLMVSPTAATLFRVVDRFSPTLFLDEFNSNANADDQQAITQVLNTGISRLATISRQVPDAEGKLKTVSFNPYCPKIIGSYKPSTSDALKSRNIPVEMEQSRRNDLPIRLSHELLNDARGVRNRLAYWRLKHFNEDLEPRLKQAEADLREAKISLRSVQINIPLYALIKDEELKEEFITLLEDRDDVLTEITKQSLDGELVETIHGFIFDVYMDENKKVEQINWLIDPPQPGSLCTEILLPKIVARLNDERPNKKDHLKPQKVGRLISDLGLMTRKVNTRSGPRGKKALVFNYERLKVLFDNLNLAYPEDFNVANGATSHKPQETNSLKVATYKENGTKSETICSQANPNKANTSKGGSIGSIKKPEIEPKKENGGVTTLI